MHERLAVYVPNENSGACRNIEAGAGIVGRSGIEGVLIHYQQPTPAVNVRTFADRCMIAAGRLVDDAPTHQQMLVHPEAVIQVGWFYPAHKRVESLPDGQSLFKLAVWVGAHDADHNTLNADVVERELRETRPDFVTLPRPQVRP